MAKYMLMLGGADLDKRSSNAALAPKMFQEFATWLGTIKQRGQYLQSHKLQDRTGARGVFGHVEPLALELLGEPVVAQPVVVEEEDA